ncbi:heterogeneous nuclear ribonucleoprotein 1 [Senna tora]|uniref:Heterogeneous nuclear ribonucleoprotein 1 n=1 Tax=Senna tora TaxID=362788 RepID=A0A834WED1_9FABA|nr:heterogeneous nuclear ribonucleoprotein 1 [Senna tora]
MDYYSQEAQLEAHTATYNGEEFREEIDRQQEGFYSEHDFDASENLNSASATIKPSSNRRDSSSGKLFVGGISWETTEEAFFKYFNKFGEIIDSVIMTNKYSGRPRGFGFVTFADSAVVDQVLAQEHTIDGRVVEVKRTVPREDMEGVGVLKTKKIFVGGIPQIFTDDELKEYFLPYGRIVEHQIMLDHNTGRSRGFGFVTFDSEDSVEKVFSVGKIHELGGKQVEIKRAEPKRGGFDSSSSSRKSYGGFGSGTDGLGRHNSRGRNDGNRGRPYADSGMNRAYSNFEEGSYGGITTNSYVGYGGYGYGYGYGGPMYYYGGYGVNSFGNPGVYGGGMPVYGTVGGYNRPGGYDSGIGKFVEKDNGHAAERYHPY